MVQFKLRLVKMLRRGFLEKWLASSVTLSRPSRTHWPRVRADHVEGLRDIYLEECEEAETINSRHKRWPRWAISRSERGGRCPGSQQCLHHVFSHLASQYTQYTWTFKFIPWSRSPQVGQAKRKRSELIECFFLVASLCLFGPLARVRYQSTESTAVTVVTWLLWLLWLLAKAPEVAKMMSQGWAKNLPLCFGTQTFCSRGKSF